LQLNFIDWVPKLAASLPRKLKLSFNLDIEPLVEWTRLIFEENFVECIRNLELVLDEKSRMVKKKSTDELFFSRAAQAYKRAASNHLSYEVCVTEAYAIFMVN